MKEADVIVLEEPKLTLADQFYLPQVLNGLGTTLKHMFRVFGTDQITIQYPEEKREDMPVEQGGMLLRTYRGVHRLNKDEEGRVKCVACFMCSTACPARCIHIEAAESPWPDREKYPQKFDIDELRCIYCGYCEDACPTNAIVLEHQYELSFYDRQSSVYTKQDLLVPPDQGHGDIPPVLQELNRRPSPPAQIDL